MSKNSKSVIAGLVFLGLIALWVGWRHGKTEADGTDSTATGSGGVTAAVVRVQRGAIEQSLTIAGAFKPFQEIDVHAKVAGYIKTIYVDVGTHVKDGQTLAILEVPELTAELAGADAAVRRRTPDRGGRRFQSCNAGVIADSVAPMGASSSAGPTPLRPRRTQLEKTRNPNPMV